jgi:opacity protein-like surface antigen
MTKHRLFRRAAAAAAATVAAAAAFAADGPQQSANYFGLHVGENNVRGAWNADVTFGPGVKLPGVATVKRGAHFGLFGGRQTEHARFELEYQHGSFDVTGLKLGPVSQAISAGGHYDALTANAYRVESVWDQRLNVYGALGVGWGRVTLPEMGFTTPPCNCFKGASKSGVTWLARAGLEYNLAANDKVFLQYTFLALSRAGSHSTPGVEYERKNAGALSVGWRHAF